ncbi:nuclear transport factor 2 family protein [Defluviimonas sp. WL0050]|uniref:Nuclear transport factor 2 family protein n=1 Tax=Albidovulum litorale TaxID=2984134 RepID=A0ABT2ZP40_9RHOB|nr:nuclear transport factor 2 family protein [Defluviimonas sp. WL0050]MCV2872908.1 nuclear transport factor 2 family protein [Defluviimonas sp. WL0050]
MGACEAIAAVVEDYVTGIARGDAVLLRRAFHPKASSIGHFDGELEWASVEEFIAACKTEAIGAETPVPPYKIESIAIAGDTAIVRVHDVWAGLNFRDTLTMLQNEGRWQIVSKVFLHLT